MKRCPCCGYLTIDDSDNVITDICEVCFWQYDEVAQNVPDVIIQQRLAVRLLLIRTLKLHFG